MSTAARFGRNNVQRYLGGALVAWASERLLRGALWVGGCAIDQGKRGTESFAPGRRRARMFGAKEVLVIDSIARLR